MTLDKMTLSDLGAYHARIGQFLRVGDRLFQDGIDPTFRFVPGEAVTITTDYKVPPVATEDPAPAIVGRGDSVADDHLSALADQLRLHPISGPLPWPLVAESKAPAVSAAPIAMSLDGVRLSVDEQGQLGAAVLRSLIDRPREPIEAAAPAVSAPVDPFVEALERGKDLATAATDYTPGERQAAPIEAIEAPARDSAPPADPEPVTDDAPGLRKGEPWTDEERDTIVKMHLAGATSQAIADQLNRTLDGVKFQIKRPLRQRIHDATAALRKTHAPGPVTVAPPPAPVAPPAAKVAAVPKVPDRPRPPLAELAVRRAAAPAPAPAAPDPVPPFTTIPPRPADAPKPAWRHELERTLRRIGNPDPFTPAVDLFVIEQQQKGFKIKEIALDLGIDFPALRSRVIALLPDVGIEAQERLITVLRERVAAEAEGVRRHA